MKTEEAKKNIQETLSKLESFNRDSDPVFSILRGSKRQALFLIKPENFLPVSNHSLTY